MPVRGAVWSSRPVLSCRATENGGLAPSVRGAVWSSRPVLSCRATENGGLAPSVRGAVWSSRWCPSIVLISALPVHRHAGWPRFGRDWCPSIVLISALPVHRHAGWPRFGRDWCPSIVLISNARAPTLISQTNMNGHGQPFCGINQQRPSADVDQPDQHERSRSTVLRHQSATPERRRDDRPMPLMCRLPPGSSGISCDADDSG